MSVSNVAADRTDDADRFAAVETAFAYAPPEPIWAPLAGDRPRAVARLLAFVTVVGLGSGLALWIAGDMVITAVRGLF
jgi:hypothetical protein